MRTERSRVPTYALSRSATPVRSLAVCAAQDDSVVSELATRFYCRSLRRSLSIARRMLAYYLHNLDPFIFRIWDNVGPRWYGMAYVLAFICGYRAAEPAFEARLPRSSANPPSAISSPGRRSSE